MMRRISGPSSEIISARRIVPVAMIGGLLAMAAISIIGGKDPIWLPIFVLVVGIPLVRLVQKEFESDCKYEVLDDGDAVVIKDENQQERIALTDIRTVELSLGKVAIHLRRHSLFGPMIFFPCQTGFMGFPRTAEIYELIRRVNTIPKG